MHTLSRWVSRHPVASFYLLALLVTWAGSLLYLQALPEHGQLPAAMSVPSAVLWYYGPCLAALVVSRVTEGRAAPRRLLSGLRVWRVGWRGYAFVLAYPLGLHLVVVWLDRLLGGPPPTFFHAQGVGGGNIVLTLLGLIVVQVLLRGIGEETGWRAFALPRLQAARGGLRASLALGVLWAAWHFHPANLGALWSPGGVFVALNIVLTAVVFTWLYNHTSGSLLIAVLFHMTLNVAEYVVPIGIADASLTRQVLQLAVLLVVVAAAVGLSGAGLGKERLAGEEHV